MDTTRRNDARLVVGLAWFTIIYNVAEGIVSVIAGALAGAVSLVGFGLDSVIEVIAASVVVVRLRAELGGAEHDEDKERVALRVIAVTFFALALYLIVAGVRDLITAERPETSPLGIVVTAISLIIMPLLALAKRRVGKRMDSRLVLADAAETALCATLSLSTLLGLVLYLFTGWTWLDAVAGFVIALFALNEGREAWSGDDD